MRLNQSVLFQAEGHSTRVTSECWSSLTHDSTQVTWQCQGSTQSVMANRLKQKLAAIQTYQVTRDARAESASWY